MFQSATIKLTAWYLVIIMVISLLFSLTIFQGINSELVRFDQLQQLRQERIERTFGDVPMPQNFPQYDPSIIAEARQRLVIILGVINVAILAASGIAGYFLAKRTLKPIKEMMDEQHRFITDASHELRTPLTSLRSEIEVNLRDKALSLSEAKKLLVSNLEEVITLQELSDNLLQLSQVQNKGVFLQPTGLVTIIEQTVKKLQPVATKKNITIHQIVKQERIMGDELSLQQLFMILIDNAIKYSHKETTITITVKRVDQQIQVIIKDQGIGIHEADIPYVFERFYRADKVRGKNVTGYGLGLSIAKKIIIEHNASINVQSKENSGTTFTIIFPATDKLLK